MKNTALQHPVKRPSSQRKLASILAAAEEEFLTHGFSASSIEAIASRAEVSKVTIYNHFGNKENLFTEMMTAQFSGVKRNFDISKLEQENLRSILIKAARDMLNFLLDEKMVRFDRMLAAEINRDPTIGLRYLEAGTKTMQQKLGALLSEAVKRGDIQSDNVFESAEMFAGLVMGRLDVQLRYGSEMTFTPSDVERRAEKGVNAWLKIHAPH